MKIEFEKIMNGRVAVRIGDSAVHYIDAVLEGPKRDVVGVLSDLAHAAQSVPDTYTVGLNPNTTVDPLQELVHQLRNTLEPTPCAADPLGQIKIMGKGAAEDMARSISAASFYLKEAIKDAGGTVEENHLREWNE